jgi:hypothetical protein
MIAWRWRLLLSQPASPFALSDDGNNYSYQQRVTACRYGSLLRSRREPCCNNPTCCPMLISRWSMSAASSAWRGIGPSDVNSSAAFARWRKRRCEWNWRREHVRFVTGAHKDKERPVQCRPWSSPRRTIRKYSARAAPPTWPPSSEDALHARQAHRVPLSPGGVPDLGHVADFCRRCRFCRK